MNNKIVVLGALLVAGNAMASNQDNDWYAGARAGVTHYSDFAPEVDNMDDQDVAGGVFLGYNITNWFALESGYTYLGNLNLGEGVGEANISTHSVELVGKLTWEATESLDLFVKAGGFAYKTDGDKGLSTLNDKGVDGTAGFGLEHHFNSNFSARLEYQFYHDLTLNDGNIDADWDTHLVALGLVYSWGQSEKVVVEAAPVTEAPVVIEEVAPIVSIEIAPQKAEVYFKSQSNTLSSASIEQLQPIIQHLVDQPAAELVAVGHADSSGSEATNQKLSEQRAKSLNDYLVKEYSIDPARITYSGEGEASPIADNSTKAGRAKNRRVSVYSPSFFVTEK